LPTEAEWEYACRAGTTTRFNTGDKDSDLAQAAWLNRNPGMRANACGQKKPNGWGLYDMHGNVWEWVQDYFGDKYYGESPAADPKGPATGEEHVLRGGGWNYGPGDCRSASRQHHDPWNRFTYRGFRAVLDFLRRVPLPASPAVRPRGQAPSRRDVGCVCRAGPGPIGR
jgi:formylglycine-generating enzyme required for sulfatase activity